MSLTQSIGFRHESRRGESDDSITTTPYLYHKILDDVIDCLSYCKYDFIDRLLMNRAIRSLGPGLVIGLWLVHMVKIVVLNDLF